MEPAIQEFLASCYDDPLKHVLGSYEWGKGALENSDGPDKWQAQQLKEIGEAIRADPTGYTIQEAIASGHGIGKSCQTAWLIKWAMDTRPGLRGIVTANTMDQLRDKTWRELAFWHNLSITKEYFTWTATRFVNKAEPEDWGISAQPNNENNSESFAGLHGRHVLIIYDESSGIPDIIWEVTEGAMTTPRAMWFCFGNPTRNTGRFRECWTKFKKRWKTRNIDSRTCKMTKKEKLNEWVEDYGEDHDFVRVRVKGEFPRVASNQFISSEDVDNALRHTTDTREFHHFPKFLGVDIAKGAESGDRSVIIRRQGPKTFEPLEFQGVEIPEFREHVERVYRDWGAHVCFVDGTGMGTSVVQDLQRAGLNTVDVLVGLPAVDQIQYANIRSELWGRGRTYLNGQVDLPVESRSLRDELVGAEFGHTKKMQIDLERKKDMRSRLGYSPDVVDAWLLTFANYTGGTSGTPSKTRRPVRRVSAYGWT